MDEKQLIEDILSNPPLKCKFSYHWDGNEELANEAYASFQAYAGMLRRDIPWLDLSSLEKVEFHSDYLDGLQILSERIGRTIKATSEPDGVSIGMVVQLKDSCVLIMKAGIAIAVLDDEDSDLQRLCIDSFLHELLHVHDYGRFQRVLPGMLNGPAPIGVKGHLMPPAQACWAEFFANKYSTTHLSSPDMHPKFLSDVLPSTLRDTREAIKVYRTSDNINALLRLVSSKIRYLFQCFGYAEGRMSALASDVQRVAPESAEALRLAGLSEIWERIRIELKLLDETRETWSSINVFEGLNSTVNQVFETFGLLMSDTPAGVFVRVPIHPLTMLSPEKS